MHKAIRRGQGADPRTVQDARALVGVHVPCTVNQTQFRQRVGSRRSDSESADSESAAGGNDTCKVHIHSMFQQQRLDVLYQTRAKLVLVQAGGVQGAVARHNDEGSLAAVDG